MRSAATWVARANAFESGQVPNPHEFLGSPRFDPKTLRVGAEQIVTLNDQFPLQHRSKFFELQGTYEDFLRCLNDLVFFWPGNEVGPTPKGKLADSFEEHYDRFGLLRIPTENAWDENSIIQFCRYNSGAPQLRDRIVRGPHIFVNHENLYTRHVAEVVFNNELNLVDGVQWRAPGKKSWELLF